MSEELKIYHILRGIETNYFIANVYGISEGELTGGNSTFRQCCLSESSIKYRWSE